MTRPPRSDPPSTAASPASDPAHHDGDVALFMLTPDPHGSIRTETPIERRFMAADLFLFRRTRGDFTFSLLMVGMVGVLLVFFSSQTGWQARKLPTDMLSYLATQLGIIDPEGRVMRLGKILKQGWVAPFLCLLILVPAVLLNLNGSWRSLRRRLRQQVPLRWRYEIGQWLRACEFIAYFILYTLSVPILGYLVSTVLMGGFLTARLGYRGWRWAAIALASSLAIVVLFRSVLQIRTPVNIWLYNQMPDGVALFLKTWF
mgnify:FL=1